MCLHQILNLIVTVNGNVFLGEDYIETKTNIVYGASNRGESLLTSEC